MPPADEPTTIPATGDLATTGPDALLRFCERARFTGSLAFQAAGARGVLPLLKGVPEIPAGDRGLERALDDFIALRTGRYTLTQLLPPLEGAAVDGELGLQGSLEHTRVGDLLRYCEAAGLTGTLSLFRDDRACIARYQRGELVSMTVDEEADADLSLLFAWDRGGYAIKARSVFERQRTSVEPADKLLRTLELELAQILERSDRAAGAGRAETASTAVRAPSMLRGSTLPFGLEESEEIEPEEDAPASPPVVVPQENVRPRSVPPPPQNPDSTVKVYFVDRAAALHPSTTQHAAANLGTETVQLDPESQRLTALRDPDRVLRAAGTTEAAPGPVVEAEPRAAGASGGPSTGAASERAANAVAPAAPGPQTARESGLGGPARPAVTAVRTSLPLTVAFGAILAATALTGLYTLVALVR